MAALDRSVSSVYMGRGKWSTDIKVTRSSSLPATGALPIGESVNTAGSPAAQLRAEVELCCLEEIRSS